VVAFLFIRHFCSIAFFRSCFVNGFHTLLYVS
jgi:hypothetical protein